jgi:hypothetical protein
MSLFPFETQNQNSKEHPFIEPIFVTKLDTRVNFLIECSDENELEELKNLLRTKSKKISFDKFKTLCQKV